MASNACDDNQNLVETGMDATPGTQPEDKPVKPTIPEEEFGSGICDSTYQPQAWKDMRKLFQQETLSDIMLMAEGQSIPCHKFLLAAASEYFYNRLVVEPERVEHNLLEMEDIRFLTLKIIVSYMYTGYISITVDNSTDVFPVLKKLGLKSACAVCEQFLMDVVNPVNCIGLYRMATEQKAKLLKAKAEEVMMGKFQEVISYPEFQNLTVSELEQYIQSDNINVPNEDPVFGAVVRWFGHQQDKQEASYCHFARVIKHVRLRYCSSHYITEVVATEPLMDTLECQKLIVAAVTSKGTYGIHQSPAHIAPQSAIVMPRKSYQKSPTLFTVGGLVSPGHVRSRECWCLSDSEHGEWDVIEESDMPQEIGLFSACLAPCGILVTGGSAGGKIISECWILSTSNFQWMPAAGLNTGRYRHASVSVGGQPYVVGGMDLDDKALSSVECLSDISSKWDKMPNLPKAMYHCIAVGCRGQLFVFGGKTDMDVFVSSFVFSKNQGEWQALPDMPRECNFGFGVAFKSKIYIVGGFEKSYLCYDPTLSQWTTLSQCQHEHADGPALVWKGKILLCGGRSRECGNDTGDGTSVIEEYDPESNTWTVSAIELPQKLRSHFVFSIERNYQI